ncbi:hypothetical protein V8E54_008485 [Elaphomyces granulatus]
MTQTQNPSLYRNVPIARNLDTRENYWFLYASKRLQKPEKDEDDPESSGREMVVFEDATANSAICMELNKTAKDTWFVDSCTSFHLTSLRSAYVEYRRVPKEEITPEDIFIDANGKPSHHVGIGTVMQKHTIKRTIDDVEDDDLDLPAFPRTRPEEIWTTAAAIRALGDRDHTQFSKPSIELFQSTMKSVDVQLQKSRLKTLEHAALQEKILADRKRKSTSRRSIHKGGVSREKIKIRNQNEKTEALRKAEKRLIQAINKAKNELKTQGIQARKDEKARRKRLKEYDEKDELPPLEDMFPIREPDKQPTTLEQLKCTEEFYPGLVQNIREIKKELGLLDLDQGDGDGDDDDEVVVRLEDSQENEDVPDYIHT